MARARNRWGWGFQDAVIGAGEARAAAPGVVELFGFGSTEVEEPLPTLHHGDLALTSTRPKDGTGGRVQVARRQPDGSWLRIIDRPETPS